MSYRKLPGRGLSTEGGLIRIRHRLFVGPDHFLVVMHKGYSEEYKRFYFKDIQAVILRKTISGIINTIILSVFVLLFLALIGLGAYWKWEVAALISLSVLASIVLGFLVLELIRGPTCAAWIRSAVQEERLFSLNRIRTARKAIRQINAILVEAQGPLPEAPQTTAPPPLPTP